MSDFSAERVLQLIPGGFLYLQCDPIEITYVSSGIERKTINGASGCNKNIREFFLGTEDEVQELFLNWVKVAQRLFRIQPWNQISAIAPLKEVKFGVGEDCFDLYHLDYHPDVSDNRVLIGIVIQVLKTNVTSPVVTDSVMSNVEKENEVTTTLSIVNTPFDEIKTFITDTSERLKNCIMSADELLDMYTTARKNFDPGKKVNSEVTCRLESIYLDTLFRHFHTIKGNAVTYEFNNLTECAHDAETIVSQLKQPPALRRTDIVKSLKDVIAKIATSFDFIITIFEKLYFAGDDEQTIRVPVKRIHTVHQLCSQLETKKVSDDINTLIRECQMLSWKTLGVVARKYNRVVYSRSVKLGKHIEFIIENPSELVEPGIFEKIDDSLVQIISNSVVHGIESNDIRFQKKKGPGHIRLSYTRQHDSVIIKISDDGQGIQTDLLIEQLIKRNELSPQKVATMNENEKIRLIFLPRASTSAAVTMFSGRGVGLDVVNNRIQLLGGSVSVETGESTGTCFTIIIPVPKKDQQ
jgi:chemotaxis protein histidine kinase CheA